jgi:hypothetical protein
MKTIDPAPTKALGPQEQRWLAAWYAMDDDCRRDNLGAMEYMAKRNPRRTKPALRLIPGGAA